MAEIVKARDTGDPEPRLVAIKRILPHLCDDLQYRDMFLDESRVLAQLSHTSVIHAFEIGEIEGTPYIALEYVDGQDARALFHATRGDGPGIPIGLACFIIARVCEGLHHAHEQTDANGQSLGIVHRDVSLQNILISYDGDVKLCDFGIAVSAENLARTEAGVVKGKFGYMSPEQIKGSPLDRRSDVFATGICLYELLTGQRLFSGENDYKAVERVRNVDIDPPSTHNRQIPSALERIVMKALAKNPRDRYASTNDLRRALQSFMADAHEYAEHENLGAFMRQVFAAEYAAGGAAQHREEPESGMLHDVSVARRPAVAGAEGRALPPTDEATTGLSAFDNLDPISALHVMPDPPVEDAQAAAPARRSGTLRWTGHGAGAPSVPSLIPSAASIPSGHGRRLELPAAIPGARFDMDWDEEEPTTVSQGFSDVPSFSGMGPGRDDTRRVPQEEALAPERRQAARSKRPLADYDPDAAHHRTLPTLEIQQPRAAGGTAVLVGLCISAALIAAVYFARDRGRGDLRLETDPADAVVLVDGKRHPVAGSPFVVSNLSTSVEHTISVEKPGYVGWSTQLRVSSAKTLALPVVRLARVEGAPEPAPAVLPPPSTITATPPAQAETPRGQSSARATSTKTRTRSSSSNSSSARRASRPTTSPTLASPTSSTPSKGGMGTLRINSRPWSQLTIDGRPAGNTPQMNLQLSAGSHKVVLKNAEFGVSKTITVHIKSGEVTTQVITLAQ